MSLSISPEYSLEILMLKRKHQCFGHLMQSQLIRKDLDPGKNWRQQEKGTTEDELVGWHHQLYGHEFEQALGDGEEQGSLECCSPRSHKESDMTERLNNRVTLWTLKFSVCTVSISDPQLFKCDSSWWKVKSNLFYDI